MGIGDNQPLHQAQTFIQGITHDLVMRIAKRLLTEELFSQVYTLCFEQKVESPYSSYLINIEKPFYEFYTRLEKQAGSSPESLTKVKEIESVYNKFKSFIGPDIKILSDLITEGKMPDDWQCLSELSDCRLLPEEIIKLAAESAITAFNEANANFSNCVPFPDPENLKFLSKVGKNSPPGQLASAA